MNERTTLATELNVFADFNPNLPEPHRGAPYVFCGNIRPALQKRVRGQMKAPRFVGGDTMNFWIDGYRAELLETIRDWDFLLINDSEARLLSGEHNLRRAARKILDMGPQTLVIKRGEYGAILFRPEGYFIAPGFLLEDVFDPTGAGDSFAGGFMGYLAQQGVSELDRTSHQHLRRAMIYGSVMGSFCCECFGVERFKRLTLEEVEARYQEFKAFTGF
jgi:sugar/nucleoside kinase (ribokinase family)